jgi:hypothetical protein
VTPRRTILLAVFAALLLLAAAGCGGGSDDGDSSSSTTTTTESTTTTGSSGARNERLTEEQWSQYEELKSQAQTVNQSAIKTFQKCRVLINQGASSQQVETCFGDSTSSVVEEGQKLLPVFEAFGQTVNGACSTATGNAYNGIKLYISSVNALDLASQGGNVPEINDVDTAKRTLVATRAQIAAFETACKPA